MPVFKRLTIVAIFATAKVFSERREGCAREEALRQKLEQLTDEHKRLKEVMVSTNFS